MAVSASTFTGVDLSRLPAPAVVEVLDYETVLGQWLAIFQAKCIASGVDYTAILESDPAYKLLEVGAYQEVIIRQRVNDAAKAVMVAYAMGGDLDQLAALVDVERYILTPANPTTGAPQVDEGDTPLRQRTILAPQGYSVAGPEGAYAFFALSADATVKDVSVDSPTPGHVLITVLGNTGDGTPSSDVGAAVTAHLTSAPLRPLTDSVTVQAATIVDYAIAATLYFLEGYDQSVVTAHAQAALADYQAQASNLGRTITRAGIIAALFATGIDNVVLATPTADVTCTMQQASHCTAVTLTNGGVAA